MGSNAWWCITVITTANDKPCGVTASLLTGATTWPYRTSSYRQYGVITFWNNLRKGGTLCPLFPVSQRLSHRKLTSHTAQLCYPYSLIATQKAKCPALESRSDGRSLWVCGWSALDNRTTRDLTKSLMVAAETEQNAKSPREAKAQKIWEDS